MSDDTLQLPYSKQGYLCHCHESILTLFRNKIRVNRNGDKGTRSHICNASHHLIADSIFTQR